MKEAEVSMGCFSIKYSNEGMRLLTHLFSIDGVGDVRDGQDQRRDVPRAQLLTDLGLDCDDERLLDGFPLLRLEEQDHSLLMRHRRPLQGTF